MQGKKILRPNKDILEKLYLTENQSPSQIARKFKICRTTVFRWLHQLKIPIKRPYVSKVKTNITELDKAYLAGYLDGDGSICAYRRKRLGAQTDVNFTSKNKELITFLQQKIGGEIRPIVYRDSRNKKEAYRLMFTNQASRLAILKELEPYLILKKKQARLMIELLERRLKARELWGNAVKVSEECWNLVDAIRRLNQQN